MARLVREPGIAQITARTVNFGAFDAPLTPTQAAACNGCVQIPWALTATGNMVTTFRSQEKNLQFSGPVLAEIYMGKITNWSNPKIKKLNPGSASRNLRSPRCSAAMAPVTSYAFTNYLSKVRNFDLEKHVWICDIGQLPGRGRSQR